MGEKEIKPADDKPKPGPLDPGGDLTTRERPGTGSSTPQQPTNQGGGGGGARDSGSSGGSWSGSSNYPDGYTMSRGEDGSWTLTHPDGSSATWDSDSKSWQGSGGQTMGSDWSGGHTPATQTDFGPKR